MTPLQLNLEGWTPPRPPTVKRGGPSYDATYNFCNSEITRLVDLYKQLKVEDQTARLIRDGIDFWLRRYHGYCIKENTGAHYFETGLSPDTKTEFEHVVPAGVARTALLVGRITVDQALQIPTCRLSKSKHKKLNSKAMKLASSTPDVFWFWRRYLDLGVTIQTHDGTLVNMPTWNLDTHYDYFK